MKILIIRHADPNYSIDSLTEKGWKEAELLSRRIAPLKVKNYYVSPLGRAKDTALLTLNKCKREAEILPWLQEFSPRINRPDENGQKEIVWDWLPEDWTNESIFFDADHWYDHPIMIDGNVKETYLDIVAKFDVLLEKHGYKRDGKIYRVMKPNHDTIVLFSHFGLECVLLSHLLNISPMPLWHGTCAAPSSVTTLYSEERREGIACFRLTSFGDVSHLYVESEEPAFSGRFCENFHDETRH